MYIVYETTNLINGKYYIGVHNLNTRKNYLGSGKILKQAVKKYGHDNFIRETLKEFDNQDDAYNYEKLIVNIKLINNQNCYNICGGGFGSSIMSENTKEKISKSRIGKYSGKDNSFYGKKHSKKTKENFSKIRKGTHKGKYNSFYGKKHTEKSKKKMSESSKGKISSMLGKHHTKETKEKMSESSQKFIYFIEGNEYKTSYQAADNLNKHQSTILDWIKNPNKPNCYRETI